MVTVNSYSKTVVASTKAFEVAPAKFFPSVEPTMMTTTGIPITAVLPSTGAPKLHTLAPVVATPMPFIEKLLDKQTSRLNEIKYRPLRLKRTPSHPFSRRIYSEYSYIH